MVNREKSAIMFSKNAKAWAKLSVMRILGLQQETGSGKYLGLPMYVGRSITRYLEYIKDWLRIRVQGWIERFLSMQGKEILVRSVVQAIPLYTKSCFGLKKDIVEYLAR